uniref:Uncharacterized protein n=1 Tax=Arundo donax TaxID=35708 RepID=A0A0A9C6F1_ARUDO
MMSIINITYLTKYLLSGKCYTCEPTHTMIHT